jgi:hypothetical protein
MPLLVEFKGQNKYKRRVERAQAGNGTISGTLL